MSQAPAAQWHQAIATMPAGGLHARPSIRLSQLARSFSSVIGIRVDDADRWTDAKSVARLMGLRIEAGRTVVLRAAGDDAEAALAALGDLIERDFEGTSG